MNLAAIVDRGLEIIAQVALLEAELKVVEATLQRAALAGEQVDLVDTEREGKQFLANGSEFIVPVVLTADLLVKSFTADSAAHRSIEAASQGKLTDLFKPVTTWKTFFDSGKIFRKKALEILGNDGPALITACVQRDKNGIPKSAIKVEWARAEKKEVA